MKKKKEIRNYDKLFQEYLNKGYSHFEAWRIASGIDAGKSPEEAVRDAKKPIRYM